MQKFIDEDFVNVRRAPNSDADIFAKIAYGDEVELLETQGDWQKLKLL